MDYALFFLLLVCSAFFSGSETAFMSLSELQLSTFKSSKRRGDRLISALRDKPQDLLITVLLGNELTNIALSIVSASIFSRLFDHLTIAQQALYSSAFVIPLLLVCGEITPKTLASYASARFAGGVVYPLSAFAWLTTPLRSILHRIAHAIVKLLSKGESDPETGLDEQGFRALVDASAREGEVEREEQELIHNAFHFGDLTVADVMRPWHVVFSLDADLTLGEALDRVSTQAYSRIPVIQNEHVLGLLYAKDLLAYRWGIHIKPTTLDEEKSISSESTLDETPSTVQTTNDTSSQHIIDLKRGVFQGDLNPSDAPISMFTHTALTTPSKTTLTHLMERFKLRRKHMAVVVNEHGEPEGLCTMEDLLEVLFGPIHEEGNGA